MALCFSEVSIFLPENTVALRVTKLLDFLVGYMYIHIYVYIYVYCGYIWSCYIPNTMIDDMNIIVGKTQYRSNIIRYVPHTMRMYHHHVTGICRFYCKVADLPPKHLRKLSATDGTKLDLNIGETQGLAA